MHQCVLDNQAWSYPPESDAAETKLDVVDDHGDRETGRPPDSVEQFLARMELPLYRYVSRHINQVDEAVDLVQDAMLRWVEAGYDKKPKDQWPALLYRIQLNRIRDWGRARRRSRLLGFFSLTPGSSASEENPWEHDLDAPGGDRPDDTHAAACLGEALVAALQALPPRQREAFNLRVLEGLDTRATATAMGVSPGSVMTHLHRATHAVQAALADHRTDVDDTGQ